MNDAAKASQNTYPPNRYPQGTRYSHRRNADANRYPLHRSGTAYFHRLRLERSALRRALYRLLHRYARRCNFSSLIWLVFVSPLGLPVLLTPFSNFNTKNDGRLFLVSTIVLALHHMRLFITVCSFHRAYSPLILNHRGCRCNILCSSPLSCRRSCSPAYGIASNFC